MSEINSTSNVTTNSFLDARGQARPKFARLTQEELLPTTLDPVTAAVTLHGALPKILSLRPQLETLATFDIRVLDNLELYLHAWLRAHALYLGSALPPEGFATLVAKVSAFRDNFASDALITDFGLREQTPVSRETTALERRQAHTLFVNTYTRFVGPSHHSLVRAGPRTLELPSRNLADMFGVGQRADEMPFSNSTRLQVA